MCVPGLHPTAPTCLSAPVCTSSSPRSPCRCKVTSRCPGYNPLDPLRRCMSNLTLDYCRSSSPPSSPLDSHATPTPAQQLPSLPLSTLPPQQQQQPVPPPVSPCLRPHEGWCNDGMGDNSRNYLTNYDCDGEHVVFSGWTSGQIDPRWHSRPVLHAY